MTEFRFVLTVSILLGFAIISGSKQASAHTNDAKPKGAPPPQKGHHQTKESTKPRKDVNSHNLTGDLQNHKNLRVGINGTCNPPTISPPSFWIADDTCKNGDTHPAQLVSQRYHCHCWGRCGYICDQKSLVRSTTTTTTRRPSQPTTCRYGGIWFPPRQNLRCFCQSFFRQPFYICTSWSGGGSNTTGSGDITTSSSVSGGPTKPGCCCCCCCSHECPPCSGGCNNSTGGCTCPPTGPTSSTAASSGAGSESTAGGSSSGAASDSTAGGGSSSGSTEATSGSTGGDTGSTSGDTGSTEGDTGSTTGATTEQETKPSTGETTEGSSAAS